MNELPEDLGRAFRKLDAWATRRAARVDPERVAARVLERLKAEPARRELMFPRRFGWPVAPRWIAVAAAALVVVAGGGVTARVLLQGGRGAAVPVPVVAAGLDSLSQQQLETVLRAAGEVKPVAVQVSGVSSAGTWDDLSEQQLRAVLQAVQQVQGETL